MKRLEQHKKLTGLMAALVFALFAVCLLLVLLTGARVYRGLVRRGGESAAERTVRDYLYTRVRQGEGLRVEKFDGCDALVTEETVGGTRYLTRVYCHEGWLWELFCPADLPAAAEDGEKVLELSSLELAMEDGVLRAVTGPEAPELVLYLRSGREVAP